MTTVTVKTLQTDQAIPGVPSGSYIIPFRYAIMLSEQAVLLLLKYFLLPAHPDP